MQRDLCEPHTARETQRWTPRVVNTDTTSLAPYSTRVLGQAQSAARQHGRLEHGIYTAGAQLVKKPPVGVRFDRPEKRLSTPGMPAYTSQERGRAPSAGSPMTEWSSLRNREHAARAQLA